MGSGLPRAGFQRVTDGAVSLDGDGYKAEGGDADRDPCRKEKRKHLESCSVSQSIQGRDI